MKMIIGLLGLIILLGAGCAVEPVGPAGVSVGVYEEYPRTYYGHGGYYPARPYRWHHPYDRDRYFYRSYRYSY